MMDPYGSMERDAPSLKSSRNKSAPARVAPVTRIFFRGLEYCSWFLSCVQRVTGRDASVVGGGSQHSRRRVVPA